MGRKRKEFLWSHWFGLSCYVNCIRLGQFILNLGAKLYTTCYPQTPPSAPQVFSSGGFLKRSFFDHLGVLSCWRGPRGRPWCHEEEEKKSRRVVTKQLRRLLFFTGKHGPSKGSAIVPLISLFDEDFLLFFLSLIFESHQE